MSEEAKNNLTDLERSIDRLLKVDRRRRECYEQKWRFGIQLAYRLDTALVDKLVQKCGFPSSPGELMINPSIICVEKALLGKSCYGSIFDEEQRKVVKQRWDELKEELGWNDRHYRILKWLKKQGSPSSDDPA